MLENFASISETLMAVNAFPADIVKKIRSDRGLGGF
jgi:hypothetical protein